MAIFNEVSTDIMILNEKKTREEYRKESFKKKYNFEPDEPGSSKGTITDKQGKKYHIDMNAKETNAKVGSENSEIKIGKNFFKLKGSHGNERRDAVLQHEIGHQNLHNSNPDAKTVDARNRSKKTFRKGVDNSIKKSTGEGSENLRSVAHKIYSNANPRMRNIIDRMTEKDLKEFIYRNTFKEDEYLKDTSEKDQKRRDSDYQKAKKFEKPNSNHIKAEEFEADRYSANRTSERALKKGLSNYKKLDNKDADREGERRKREKLEQIKRDVEPGKVRKHYKKASKEIDNETKRFKRESEDDFVQRSKALKDKDLRSAKTYK